MGRWDLWAGLALKGSEGQQQQCRYSHLSHQVFIYYYCCDLFDVCGCVRCVLEGSRGLQQAAREEKGTKKQVEKKKRKAD